MPLSQKTMSMMASPTVAASPPPRIERATAACMLKTAKTLYKPPSSVHAQAERLARADAEACPRPRRRGLWGGLAGALTDVERATLSALMAKLGGANANS